ncbi:MAG: FHA domain-containing protein, partial [Microcystaceae cyanobacterium]
MTPFHRKLGKSAIAVIAMTHTQQPLSQLVTQVVQHFIAPGAAKLKKGARVAQLLVKETAESPAVPYQLLGDRWLIGRSSRNCDIVLQNPMVSKIHCSIRRHPDSPHCFELQDEQSNNGVYQGEKKITKRRLRPGDVISLGPTAMVESPQLIFQYPAPPWLTILRYGGWSLAGITGCLIALTLWEGSKVTV